MRARLALDRDFSLLHAARGWDSRDSQYLPIREIFFSASNVPPRDYGVTVYRFAMKLCILIEVMRAAVKLFCALLCDEVH